MKQVPRLTKVFGRERDYFIPLGKKEMNFVGSIGNPEHKTVLSKVVVGEMKHIQVIDGLLKDYVGDIVKINPHKGEVTIEVEFMGGRLGLKMVSKCW